MLGKTSDLLSTSSIDITAPKETDSGTKLDTSTTKLKETVKSQLSSLHISDDSSIGLSSKDKTREERVYELGHQYFELHSLEMESGPVTSLSEEAIPLFRELASEATTELLESIPISNKLDTRLEAMAFLHRYGLLHRTESSEAIYGDKSTPLNPDTPSPYTFNSLLNFSALAESIIKMADSYTGFDNPDVIQRRGQEILQSIRQFLTALGSDPDPESALEDPQAIFEMAPCKPEGKMEKAVTKAMAAIYDSLETKGKEGFIETVSACLADILTLTDWGKKDLPENWKKGITEFAGALYNNLMSGTVQHFMNSLPKSIPGTLIPELLICRSFKEFNQHADLALAKLTEEDLEAYPWKSHVERRQEAILKKMKVSSPEESVLKEIRLEAFRQDVKRRLWGIVQLWHLESARRRAGGVINAVNVRMGLAALQEEEEENVKTKTASDIVVTQNVLSGKGASGKSQDPNPAKYERLQKSAEILMRLLNGGSISDQPLAKLKKQLIAFIQTIEKDPAFKNAGKAWLAAAGLEENSFDSEQGRMSLHVSKALKKDSNIEALKKSDAWGTLQKSFRAFMASHYTNPEVSQDKSSDKSMDISSSDEDEDKIEITPFTMWLINKAASEGHQSVLTQVIKDETSLLDGFLGNRDAEHALAVRHVALLRQAYHIIGQFEFHPLQSLKVHSHNPAEHLDTEFQDYASIYEIERGMQKIIPASKGFFAEILKLLEPLTTDGVKEIYPNLLPMKEDLEKALKEALPDTSKMKPREITKKQNEVIAKLAEQYAEDAKLRKAELLNPKEVVLDPSFSRQEAIVQHHYIRPAEFLMDAEQLILDESTSKAKVKKEKTGASKEVETAISRLKGLSRVWGAVEPVRDFAAGIANFFAAFGQAGDEYLSFTALFSHVNIMSPKNINMDNALKSKRFEQLFNQLQWNKPEELNKLMDEFTKKWNAEFKDHQIDESVAKKITEELKKIQETAKESKKDISVQDIKQALEAAFEKKLTKEEESFFVKTLSFDIGVPAKIRQLINSLLKDITILNTIKEKVLLERLREVVKADIKKILLLMNGLETAGLFKFKGATNISPLKTWDIEGDNNCAFNSFAFGLMQLVLEKQIDSEEVRKQLNISEEEWPKVLDLAKEALEKPEKSVELQKLLAPRLREMAIESFDKRQLETTIRQDFLATVEHQAKRAIAGGAEKVLGGKLMEHMRTGIKKKAEEMRIRYKDAQLLQKACDEAVHKKKAEIHETALKHAQEIIPLAKKQAIETYLELRNRDYEDAVKSLEGLESLDEMQLDELILTLPESVQKMIRDKCLEMNVIPLEAKREGVRIYMQGSVLYTTHALKDLQGIAEKLDAEELSESTLDEIIDTMPSDFPKIVEKFVRDSQAQVLKRAEYEAFMMQYLLETELGIRPLESDLFNDPESEVAQQIALAANEIANQFHLEGSDPDTLISLKKLTLGDWFDSKGKDAYLKNLGKSGIWGGPAELNGLARRFGIQLLMVGQQTIDEGSDTWGSFKIMITEVDIAMKDESAVKEMDVVMKEKVSLNMDEIAILRKAELISGVPVEAGEENTVFFKLASEGDIREKLKDHEHLLEKFLALYKDHYKEPRVFLGLRNDHGTHWETLSSKDGSFNLNNLFKAGKLKNKYLKDYFGAGPSYGSSSFDGYIYDTVSSFRRGSPAEFTHIRLWDIEGDNNCAFNAFAFSLMQLAVEDKAQAKHIQEVLGLDNFQFTYLIGLAKKAKDNKQASVELQKSLAPLLRDLAKKNMSEETLLGGILQDLKATFDTMVYREIHSAFMKENKVQTKAFAQLAGNIASSIKVLSKDAESIHKNFTMTFKDLKGLGERFEEIFGKKPDAAPGLFKHFLYALNYEIRRRLNMIGLSSDLFNDSQSPVKKALNKHVQTSIETIKSGDKTVEKIIEEETAKLELWFNGDGKQEYLDFLGKDKVWGGSAELNTLAGLFGIKLLLIGGHNMDEGVGYGTVDVYCDVTKKPVLHEHVLTAEELQLLMSNELIEGKPIKEDGINTLHFRLVSETIIKDRLKKHEALLAKFLKLGKHFILPQALISVRNKYGGHWEAVSSPDGHFNVLPDFLGGKIHRKHEEPVPFSLSTSGKGKTSSESSVVSATHGKKALDAIVEGSYSVLTDLGVTVMSTDITTLDGHDSNILTGISPSDSVAIVNAANGKLLGGGGIDGAIHKFANTGQLGVTLGKLAVQEAQKSLAKDTCGEGEAVITDSLNFKTHNIAHIIHTVGPNWSVKAPMSGSMEEAASLKALSMCYFNSLKQAMEKGDTAVIFCSISTSIFGVPKDKAVPAQLEGIRLFFEAYPLMKGNMKVYLNAFDTSKDGISLEAMYKKAIKKS